MQQRIQDKLIFEDLDEKYDVQVNTGPPLVLTQVDRYLHGPVSSNENNHDTTDQVNTSIAQLLKDIDKWTESGFLSRKPSMSLVNPAAAVSALGELTPGGSLMKGFREDSLGREYILNFVFFIFFFFNILLLIFFF